MPHSPSPRSAYLHIPFCHRRCYYCDFAVVPLGDRARGDTGPGSASIQNYLTLLQREIASAPAGPPLSTVYLGGGTPSLLTAVQIGDLLECLRRRYGFQEGAEITLEMDPASFDADQLTDVLLTGVNRVSLGGQSFDDAALERMGRRHRGKDLQEACRWMREAFRSGSLRSWSLDLIQSLPGQTLDAWRDQLQQAIRSEAPHLSVYELTIEPGTVFGKRHAKGQLTLPEEEEALHLMAITSEHLSKAGLSRYEISSYARPGHASRHNRVYWSGAGWWGFGMGATAAPWGERVAHPRTREAYAAWLEADIKHPVSPEGLPVDDLLLVGLRRREGVDLRDLDAADLVRRWLPFQEQGVLSKRAGRWCLSDPDGMALSNRVLLEVVLWWEEQEVGDRIQSSI